MTEEQKITTIRKTQSEKKKNWTDRGGNVRVTINNY